ncbi:hypothetical protein WJX81_005799 [Elliptochloris bilobata]|uniref:AAA+ ATPase domain-containing protein n=1 Tax=Elliptochloris bilobata TaxID=381761 RepID=A0AAW1SFC3_9CHLO
MYCRVLWTKQLIRKSKTWHDGFLEVNEEKGSRTALLLDEDRSSLASGRIPSSLQITEESEVTAENGAAATLPAQRATRTDEDILLLLAGMYLTLGGGPEAGSGRGAKPDFRKDDLWVLGSGPELEAPTAGGVGDRLVAPWVAIARSAWHGPNREGRFEIEFLAGRPAGLRSGQAVCALHGPEAASELAMLAVLRSAALRRLPLLPALLRPLPARSLEGGAEGCCVGDGIAGNDEAAGSQGGAVEAAAGKVTQRFGLNADQAAVVRSTVPWFAADVPPQALSPLCVVHGPFGSGKSTLLVALLHFFAAAGAKRCLVAANTNIAVDRILCGLLDTGFTDFLRVGALRRIDRRLLHHSLHCGAGGCSRNDATAELADMLKAATSPAEAAVLHAELAQVKAGAARARQQRLGTAAVVGVTCCSAALPALDDTAFDVVVLDEASQMIEPLSLLPLARAGCRFAVLAGDPCQLPPVLCAPSEQYRCHPDLAAVPNAAFYHGRLRDGCTAAQRGPLLPGLPPLVFADVRGRAEACAGSRSTANRAEAAAVAQIVRQLVAGGVAPEDIGVICFFRAQVALVQALLAQQPHAAGAQAPVPPLQKHAACQGDAPADLGATSVATVDSFQGMEKAVIVLSLTVSRAGSFAADAQRLNVALTRARNHLFIVGAAPVAQATSPALRACLAAEGGRPGSFIPAGKPLVLPRVATLLGAAAAAADDLGAALAALARR